MLRPALAFVMAASLCTSTRGGYVVYFDVPAALQPHQGKQVVHAFLKAETNDEPAFNGLALGAILTGPPGIKFSQGPIRLKGADYVWDIHGSELGGQPADSNTKAAHSIRFTDGDAKVQLKAGDIVKLASFSIDTTDPGHISINLPQDEFTPNFLTPAERGAEPILFAVQPASLNIVATPEPGTLGCVALCAAISVGIRKRISRRRKSGARVV